MLVKITRKIEVANLTAEDIEMLDVTTLRTIVKELLHRPSVKPSKPVPNTNTQVEPSKASTAKPRAVLNSFTAKKKSSGIPTGTNSGISSKYHYVYFDNTTKKYSTTFNKKSYESELLAAIAADATLDARNDIKRPRNRDEFIEIKNYTSTPNIVDYIEELQ